MQEHLPTDHDLLIRLTEKMSSTEAKVDQLRDEVKDLKNNFAARMESLEKNKIDIDTFQNYQKEHERMHDLHIADSKNREIRINDIEKKLSDYPLVRSLAFGGVGLILVAFMTAIITFVIPKV